jgi:dihydrofolate synthase/folylpolyglutamate synthase
VQLFSEALKWVHDLRTFGIKPGLKRMEWMMKQLGHPERRLKCIHIGGTNGKGSTVTFLRNMLQEAGYEVGTFTSPYIEHFNERISVNGLPIGDEDFLQAANKVRPLAEQLKETELGSPTEFEVVTAIAIVYFAELSFPDIVLFEVGLGGRFDSTNIIHPLITVITNVGYDHMNILGDSIEEIAFEKSGIIKPGVPVITTAQKREAVHVIGQTAEQKRSKMYLVDKHFSYHNHLADRNGESFTFQSLLSDFENLHIRMMGEHQVNNAALALMTVVYLKTYYSIIINEEEIKRGLERSKWIGRFEQMSTNPTVIVDGAHNIEGVQSLKQTLLSHFQQKRVNIVFASLKDKPVEGMLSELYEIIDHITFTSFDFLRAYKANELLELSSFEQKDYEENFKTAIDKGIDKLAKDEILVITGSLYFVSDARNYLLSKKP